MPKHRENTISHGHHDDDKLAMIPAKIISMGHTDWIRSVALSSDAKIALSGSEDKTLRVWDVASGHCSLVLEGHTDRVWGVALSADGKLAVSGSNDGTVRVWNLATGCCSLVLEGHTDKVLGVALSADGKLALSGSEDKTVRVWDLTTGHCSLVLESHAGRVWGVALSGDSKLALSGSSDKKVRLWDLDTGRCSRVLEGHTDKVWGVSLSADGKFALSGSSDNTLRIWDFETGISRVLEGHTDCVWGVALSADSKLALSGSQDKCVRVWDPESGRSNVLEGHSASVWGVALSADARLALSGSADKTVRVWDLEKERDRVLEGHSDRVLCVALSANGKIALSGSDDKTVREWDLISGHSYALKGHTAIVTSVALSADCKLALSCSADNTVRLWDLASRHSRVLVGHYDRVWGVALSADAKRAVSGSSDKTVRVWDLENNRSTDVLKGHSGNVSSVALSADGKLALSGSNDETVRVWDLESGGSHVLEGHTDKVFSVALTADGKMAFSGSADKTVRVWDLESGRSQILRGHADGVFGVALNADGKLSISMAINGVARVWSMKGIFDVPAAALEQTTQYTNAKVVLVGESGVGKTGLALRLCEDRWEATESTHGMTVKQLELPAFKNSDGFEREVWLWDFAGQPDYRLIHQLYMDETALGVLVFDPQDDNPFDALGHWEKALQSAFKTRGFPPAKLLVAARCDRGGITVSRKRFESFCEEHGCKALYLTGAKTGDGCEELKNAIAEHIPWDQLESRSTPEIFKALKDSLIKLKDENAPLFRVKELHHRFQQMLPDKTITEPELRAVISLMQGQGMVQMLDFGDFVLLQPEQINCYASVVVRMAREHVDELGTIPEQQVLDGRLDYQGMPRLSVPEEKILLRAMVQTIVERALCLREDTPKGTLLVFPSYFRRDKPEVPDHPNVFVTYAFAGPLDDIYTTLVVKLCYSEGFKKDLLWKDAADFKTPAGKRVGLAMKKKSEGTAELVVYFEAGVPDDTKVMFIKYVHEHLLARAQDVTRVRTYVCPHCDTPMENRKAIEIRLKNDHRDVICGACEKRVLLIDLVEEKFASDEFRQRVREMDERARINLDNESRELILVGHAFAIAGEAGQIFRPTPNSDWGIDGEIEFKDHAGNASGERLYLQLKSGDSYLYHRQRDNQEIFTIKKERQSAYWQQQAYPVMLVIRTSDGQIRWMDVTDYLKRESDGGKKLVKQIVFDGEPFTADNLRKTRDRLVH